MTSQDENWNMIALKTESGPRIYRIRDQTPSGASPETHGNCVVVEWRFADAGLPDKGLQQAHAEFENHLDALDDNPNSVLMHVYTGNGAKEWCYYARDYPKFMAELNALLAGKPRFPIAIEHMDDPTWKYRTSIREFAESGSSAEQTEEANKAPAASRPWWKKLVGG